jgi:hypothetical protein
VTPPFCPLSIYSSAILHRSVSSLTYSHCSRSAAGILAVLLDHRITADPTDALAAMLCTTTAHLGHNIGAPATGLKFEKVRAELACKCRLGSAPARVGFLIAGPSGFSKESPQRRFALRSFNSVVGTG